MDGSLVPVPAVSRISFNSSPASGDTYELGERIVVEVAFNRPVTVTGNPQMALTIGSRTRQATLSNLASSGSDGSGSYTWYRYFEYTVQAADVDTDGVSIAANAISLNGGSIKAEVDGATNADLTHAAVAADPSRKVDGTQVTTPAVSRISFLRPTGGTWGRGEAIIVGVSFDRSVTVTGSPQVGLTIGTRTRYATYSAVTSSISGGCCAFEYRVQAADVDTDGISIAANALRLNGGTIKASDGTTAADLTHTAVAADSNYRVDGSQVIAPVLTGVVLLSVPGSDATYELGETITVVVQFDKPVEVTGSPRMRLIVGSRTRYATHDRNPSSLSSLLPSGSSTLLEYYAFFTYTVQAGDRDTDGIIIPPNAIDLNGGIITHGSDNTSDAVLTHDAVPPHPNFKVDGGSSTEPAPEVSSISFSGAPADGDTYHFGETIEVEVAFDQPVTVTGHPQVALTVGSRIRYATPHYDTSGGGSPGAPGPAPPGVPGSPRRFLVSVLRVRRAGGGCGHRRSQYRGQRYQAQRWEHQGGLRWHHQRRSDAHRRARRREPEGGRQPRPGSRRCSSISFNSSPASGDTYELGESIDVRVEFDRPVRVAGTPQLALTIGSRTRQVPLRGYYSDAYSGGRQSLYFGYQVQAADVDTDGISIAANAISLNGGSIKAEVDGITDADLTHAAVAADRNRKVDGSRVSAPVVSRILYNSSPASGDTYELGERIEVRVEFDRPVTVTGTPQVALTVGSRTRQATLPSYYSDPDFGGFHNLYFEYTVQAEDRDTDGISIAANAISLNGGSIKAEANGITDADLVHAAVAADPNRKVDGSRVTTPTVSRISFNSSPASGDTYELRERIEVEVEFDRPVRVTGNPQVER